MQVSVLHENLKHALKTVAPFVDSKPQLPVLANVLLEADGSKLKISATNLQSLITVTVGAKVDQPGSITLPLATFKALVDKMSKERVDMLLDSQTHTVSLKCGSTRASIKGITADEYPPVAMPADLPNRLTFGSTDALALIKAVNAVAMCAAKETNRPILNAINIIITAQQVACAAADGYRLGVSGCEATSSNIDLQQINVLAESLKKILDCVQKDESIEVGFDNDRLWIETQSISAGAPIVEGRFPDYTAIIPRNKVISSNMFRDDLLSGVERAQIFSRDSANSMRVHLKQDETHLVGKSAERGDGVTVIEAGAAHNYEADVDACVNAKYLIESIKSFDTEYITLEINGAENPLVVKAQQAEHFHVIMPMSK